MLHPVGHTYSNGWKILICQEISHFRVALSSVSKRVLVNNLLHGNELDLQGNKPTRRTHFHMKGYSPRLVLKQR